MKNFKRLLRRRKTLIVAFIAAVGSFVMGVTLPMNSRGNQPASLSQAQLVTASQSQVQQSKSIVNNLKQSIAERVEFSENTLDRLEKVRFNSSLPSKFKGTTLRQAKLDSRQKAIALTFDDGPWPTTTVQILDILKQNNIKGTFFWVGRYLQVYPELGKKVAQAGHAIGNHTWNHQYIKYNEEGAASEIDRTTSLIEELTGIRTYMFRPPGGILNNGLAAYAQKKNYTVVMWSADSLDWRTAEQSLMENVMRQANSGGIVLMHDGGGNRSRTVEALPNIIAKLKKEGYTFVTVPELLEMEAKNSKQQETAQK
ncbi:MAG: polysaccharide deacetylase family protein [Oscillatoriales cyanobacterium]|uniref:Polysaccharide deacetylase family protein n=1 Tax=Microcoleus anatoxicus PTRS2 TaxID=2705321 RepID=A0ABU8YPS5_9CYAN|nr:MAG: polysaccharide deacetylase family protein [Oscillatoriales cyanobacterium]TAD93492.1 MAG: polysaccharide deacetylase family protein [Oscillatoriales cyanobacterium]TAE03989.1 MAG: polysaccharide deacetylase family protein [Oscillatoriales cyanobacterium]TAF01738.1 MAG: polysaccharide deacetylase family protein [Oscillatoriales cyanobacterium]TAF36184.1 MAG: polysaccharide deacetylase family protein [Oscillatoriales cyanobacterium]